MKKDILSRIAFLAGIAGSVSVVGMVAKKMINVSGKQVDLYQSSYNIMNQWVAKKQRGISLEQYFDKNEYKSVAIYGMGTMGILLFDELKDTNIEIKYGIDKDPYCTYPGLEIVEPGDGLEKVDVIVVTIVTAFNGIKNMLSEYTDIPIVSIEDVVY